MPDSATARGGRPPRIRPAEVLDVLVARDDDSWTMASVASELGVSEAAIYYYFPTKTDLMVALGKRLFSELDLPRPDGDWEAWLAAVGLCMYDFFARYPMMTTASPDVFGDVTGKVLPTDSVLEDLLTVGFPLIDASTVITTLLMLATGYANLAVFLEGPRGARFKARIIQEAGRAPDSLTSQTQLEANAWDIRDRFAAALSASISGFGTLRRNDG
jgi:AcrR family transcriptional regulator